MFRHDTFLFSFPTPYVNAHYYSIAIADVEDSRSQTLIKDPVLGLRQILATESPLKVMKNAFFYIKIYFCSWRFGYVEKRPAKKGKVNLKTYDVTDEITNNYNTHIAQYLKK